MNKQYDYLVVGAGLYGAVFAHAPEAVTVQVFNTITSACSGWVVMVYPAA